MNLKSLFAKLNDTCRNATESAAALCLSDGHYEVDIEHFLLKLLDGDDNDLLPIMRYYDVAPERLRSQLTNILTTFKNGNTRTPALSPHIAQLIERAWVLATIEYGVNQIRSAHMLQALLDDQELRRIGIASAPELVKINADDLRLNLVAMVEHSAETQNSRLQQVAEKTTEVDGSKKRGKTPALDQYTVDLTQSARDGRIDPVNGREFEVRQIIDILTRRRQNNPILTGEAGVGKTAVVEGLALRIATGQVPIGLENVAIHALDLGLLQAGAGLKGEFESRLKSVIDETKRSLHPIILFIDEAHTLIGSGGQAGQNDAANLLKPALARGELRTIAATTWAEYKKYFEKDAALARRFQVVKIEEPDEEKAFHMVRGLVDKMQSHHKVAVMHEAIMQAVRWSNRYIIGRLLPDKAVSVLDTACARVALGQSSEPGLLEDCKRQIENVQAEILILENEQASGCDHSRRLTMLAVELLAATQHRERLNAQWARELELVTRIQELSAYSLKQTTDENIVSLAQARAELISVQGTKPLVHALVDGAAIAEVISAWTGIPLGKMQRDQIEVVQQLPLLLGQRVLGQDHALEEIGKRISISRARMEDPDKPIGVFLLLGPSGVGKTETALALADTLYGGERNLITINMSEYQEAHSVSSLKGSPPGYVGYGEGGVLTEAVRKKPYCVVLLDEVEKAHPDVLELFFQVFDKGVLDDAEGREINFRNTIIILTSNVGTEQILRTCVGGAIPPSPNEIVEVLRDQLNQAFKPAFLGRLSILPYYPITDAVLAQIVDLKLQRIRERFERNHQASFSYDAKLIPVIAARCTEVDSGARNIDNILSGTLMPEVSRLVLERMAQNTPIVSLSVKIDRKGDFAYRMR